MCQCRQLVATWNECWSDDQEPESCLRNTGARSSAAAVQGRGPTSTLIAPGRQPHVCAKGPTWISNQRSIQALSEPEFYASKSSNPTFVSFSCYLVEPSSLQSASAIVQPLGTHGRHHAHLCLALQHPVTNRIAPRPPSFDLSLRRLLGILPMGSPS